MMVTLLFQVHAIVFIIISFPKKDSQNGAIVFRNIAFPEKDSPINITA